MASNVRRNGELSLLVLGALIVVGGLWLTKLARIQISRTEMITYSSILIVLFAAAHLAVRMLAPSADPLFLPLALFLFSIGFVLITRLENSTRIKISAAAQVRWVGLAIVAFILVLIFVKDVRSLARYRYSFAALGVALLLLPTVPGIGREINGARLWIGIGPLSYEPSELAKISLVIFFAGYFSERSALLRVAKKRLGPIGIPDARHFGPVVLAWALSLLILINQKDLGISLLFFAIFIVMLWTATSRPAYLISGLLLFVVGAFVSYKLISHIQVRFEIWRDPFSYMSGKGYQIVQSLFALATGGAWGTGLGLGRPDLIPNVQTDFIFSAIGEELGLAGTAGVLTAFALFTARGIGTATRCRDDFSKLLVSGLTLTIALQSVIIMGGVTRLIPLTGVTLPFMSYGGSSLVSNFILIALLLRSSDEVAQQSGEGPPTELSLPAGGGR